MARLQKISFGFNDRTICVGGTGSGKTTFLKALLNQYYRASEGKIPLYIIDPKQFGDFDEYGKQGIGRIIKSEIPPDPFIPNAEDGSFLVWQTYSTDESDEGVYGQFLMKIFNERKPCLIFIDELSALSSQSGRKYPKALDLIYKQGRALNIGTLLATQTVSSFPKVTLTQSSKLFRFNLNDEYDVKKLSSIAGENIKTPPRDSYGFWYKDLMKPVAHSPAQYFKDYKEFFGGVR